MKTRILVSLLVALSILAFSWIPRIAISEGSESLSPWLYRKGHIIMGSTAGAQSNYPIMINVHYNSGSDAGGMFILTRSVEQTSATSDSQIQQGQTSTIGCNRKQKLSKPSFG